MSQNIHRLAQKQQEQRDRESKLELNSSQKKSIMIMSLMGTLISEYKEEQKTKKVKILEAKFGKAMRKYCFRMGFEQLLKDCDRIWSETIDEHKNNPIAIDGLISFLHGADEDNQKKYFGIGSRIIGDFAKTLRISTYENKEKNSEKAKEYDDNSRNITKCLIEKINTHLGIETISATEKFKEFMKNRQSTAS